MVGVEDIALSAAERRDLIRVLATIYRAEEAAGPVLDQLGIPVERRPAWRTLTPEQWWTLLAHDLDAGIVAAPYRELAGLALAAAPFNAVLGRIAARHGLTPPSRADRGQADPGQAAPGSDRPGPERLEPSRRPVFLAYAEEDRAQVASWYRRLTDDGVPVWMDVEDIPPGRAWQWAIREAIVEAAAFVVFLSTASLSRRGYVHREVTRAIEVAEQVPEGGTFIIPARLDACELPARLNEWNAVDMFAPDGYHRLLSALRDLV